MAFTSPLRLPIPVGVLFLCCLLCAPVPSLRAAPAQALKQAGTSDTPGDPLKPDQLEEDEINRLLNALIDAKIKLALKKERTDPTSEAAPAGEGRWLRRAFFRAEDAVSDLFRGGKFLMSGIRAAPHELPLAFQKLTDGGGMACFVRILLKLTAIILTGMMAEKLLRRHMSDLRRKIISVPPSAASKRLLRIVLRLALDVLCAGCYVLVTFALFSIFYDKDNFPLRYYFAAACLIISYHLRLIRLMADVLLLPDTPALRLLSLDDAGARHIRRWVMWTARIALFLGITAILLKLTGISEALYMVIYNTAGLSMVIMVIMMIWQSRRRVAQWIRDNYLVWEDQISPLEEKLASLWHVPAIAYVLIIDTFWQIGLLTSGDDYLADRLILSFLCIPIYLLAQQGGRGCFGWPLTGCMSSRSASDCQIRMTGTMRGTGLRAGMTGCPKKPRRRWFQKMRRMSRKNGWPWSDTFP
ncbi:hypothetical protein [Desulfonema ishimotonii]|uniref:hypothetical protein n=1 Tax=Desulfonema ishimotonii TaxID=45657 RepID=UPI001AA07265|nr:hypothetical protein [Desulfonema ishimotonii]